MHGERLPGRGLTAHYFFTFGVEVQLVGDRKNTKVEHRILHLDVAAAAIKLIEKGSVRVFLRFDSINQIVFDDAEPRSVLISCRDERRFFVVFQGSEDNLVFRSACSDLAAAHLDINRFQRSVLKKGQLMKRGKAGALFGDRYAILTPRKLFVLPSKVSVFPSNAISLEEVSPRFDDVRGTIHLDVSGKEFVFQGSDKEESQDWFVEIARTATSRAPILQWDDVTAEAMRQEADMQADEGDEEEEQQEAADALPSGPSSFGRLAGVLSGPGASHGPSHFTSPDDWQEFDSPDHHLDMAAEAAAAAAAAAGQRAALLHSHSQGGGGGSRAAAAAGGIGRGLPGSFSSSGGSFVDPRGNVFRLGSGAARSGAGAGEREQQQRLAASRSLRRSGSGMSSSSGAQARGAGAQRLQSAAQGSAATSSSFDAGPGRGPDEGGGWSSPSTPRSASGRQQPAAASAAAAARAGLAPASDAHGSGSGGHALGTIDEAGESSEADRSPPTSGTEELQDERWVAADDAWQPPAHQQRPPPPPLPLKPARGQQQRLPAQQQQQQQQRQQPLPRQADMHRAAPAAAMAAAAAARSRAVSWQRQQQQQQQQQEDGETTAEEEERQGPASVDVDSFFANYSTPADVAAGASGDVQLLPPAQAAAARQQGRPAPAGHLGFISPGSPVDLAALTAAVAARLSQASTQQAAQHVMCQQQRQQMASQPEQQPCTLDTPAHCCCRQPAQAQQQLPCTTCCCSPGWQTGPPTTAAAGAAAPASACSWRSSSPAVPAAASAVSGSPDGRSNQPFSMAAGWPSSPVAHSGSPPAAASQRANWAGSSSWEASSSSSGSRPLSSTGGWGRKSLAGLYSHTSTTKTEAAGSASKGLSNGGRASVLAGRGGSTGGSGSGVVLGEYIIPSVLGVIVRCPEGRQLSQELQGQPELTPHQRCLALLRWVFRVYSQLPDDARLAIPSGPHAAPVAAWQNPDIGSLVSTIQQQMHHTLQAQQLANEQLQQQHLMMQQQRQVHSLYAAQHGSPHRPFAMPWVQPVSSLAGSPVAGIGHWQQQLQPPLPSAMSGFSAAPLLSPGTAAPAQLQLLLQQLQQLLAAAAPVSPRAVAVPDAVAAAAASTASNLVALLQQAALCVAAGQQAQQPPTSAAAAGLDCGGARTHKVCSKRGKRRPHAEEQEQQPDSSSLSSSSDAPVGNACCSSRPARGVSNLHAFGQHFVPAASKHSRHSVAGTDCSSGCDEGSGPDGSATAGAAEATGRLRVTLSRGAARGRHLRGRCSFTCDNPLFQLEGPSHQQQQQQSGAAGAGPTPRCGDAGQLWALPGDACWAAAEGRAAAGSSSRCSNDGAAGGSSQAVGSRQGASGCSSCRHHHRHQRTGAVCCLSPEAAETICRAASTAAAAAAAAVRSAVLTLDAQEEPSAPGRRVHSVQSLVGQVDRSELDAAGFVETVAAGRAGPLLRPAR